MTDVTGLDWLFILMLVLAAILIAVGLDFLIHDRKPKDRKDK